MTESLNFSGSTKNKVIIGVDPGANGAIAWADLSGVHCENIPETRGDAIALVKRICANSDATAYHEKISGWIPDGGASMMFQFGRNVERIGCILEVLGVRIIEIRPQGWQSGLHLPQVKRQKVPRAPKGLSKEQKAMFAIANKEQIAAAKAVNARAKSDHKNNLKAEAQRRFPGLNITLKNCDALLIMDYGIREEMIKQNGF